MDLKNNILFVIVAYIRDANGATTSVKGIRLNICDVNWRPPQTILARKMLTDTVTATQSERSKSVQINGIFYIDPIREYACGCGL